MKTPYNHLCLQEHVAAPFTSAWRTPRCFTALFARNGTGELWRTFMTQAPVIRNGVVLTDARLTFRRAGGGQKANG